MTERLRPVAAINEGKPLRRAPIAPPPKIVWLALDQLVIDETYQRALSEKSAALIRRLVERWDWNRFKPLSVAACGEGRYEIVDGQHTAIAAATHGSIEMLPCLVLDAATLAERAAAFVGINTDRVRLTAFALYQAKLAAGDEEAVPVATALERSGAQLVESIRLGVDYPVGTVACIGTLLMIVRGGGHARLTRLLKHCIAAGFTVTPSMVLKGLEAVVTMPGGPTDAQIAAVLASRAPDEILERAVERRRVGRAATGADAVAQVIMHAIEREAGHE